MNASFYEKYAGLLFLGGCLAFISIFQAILLPFVIGFIVAYLLDPLVDRTESILRSRTLSTFIALCLFATLIIGFFVLLVPLLQTQFSGFLDRALLYSGHFQQKISHTIATFLSENPDEISEKFLPLAKQNSARLIAWSGAFVEKISFGSNYIFNFLSLMVVTPVVTFFLLRDWDKIVSRLNDLLPKKYAKTIRKRCQEIDNILASYFRGITLVCLTLAAFYSISLSIVGLEYGFIIGILSGALSFVPFIGTLIGLLLSVGFAYLQFNDPFLISLVVGVFAVGQIAEGNFLTPTLVGDKIGLHPVWVIFSLMAGGALAGFLGILLALPLAAVIGVLAHALTDSYKKSKLYNSK